MKTQNNITRKATRFATTAALFVITLASAKAGNGMIAAADRLESLDLNAELILKYEAPSVDRDADLAEFEFTAAADRLENLSTVVEASVRYEAPGLDNAEEIAAYETVAAAERLDKLIAAIEQTVQYRPEAR